MELQQPPDLNVQEADLLRQYDNAYPWGVTFSETDHLRQNALDETLISATPVPNISLPIHWINNKN